MDKIEQPKVFISYAWGTPEYEERVISFAASLVDDGVEVLIDKWSLKEGNDTYSFMEKSVLDPTITNVILLLDPTYEEKANKKQGGVGTETQIISSEVYNKTEQTKFLPVVFLRKPDGGIPKPVYLRNTLHFDLSTDESFENEYRRLVKRLYGVEEYKKPKLGNKPSWVDEQIDVSVAKRATKYDAIRKVTSQEERKIKYIESINDFSTRLSNFSLMGDINDPIEIYNGLKPLRDDTLALFAMLPYSRECVTRLTDSLDALRVEEALNQGGLYSEMKRSLLHELFLYLVAICYNNDLFEELGYVLNRPYTADYRNEPGSFLVFYHHNGPLDQAVCKKDDENYFSGTANCWIDNINTSVCNKNEFVFADLLCFNCSIIQHKERSDHYWFPLTYVYVPDNNQSSFSRFANGLISKRKAKQATSIFGFDNIEQFLESVKEIAGDSDRTDDYRHVRYGASFVSPATIFDKIDIDQIATKC